MKYPKYGYIWGDRWVFASIMNIPCIMHNYPPSQIAFDDIVKFQFYDRILTDAEIKEIADEWTKSEDK